MSGRLSPTLDNEMQFFPIHNWQQEFIDCDKLNMKNLVWVIDLPTIITNPLLSNNKISNIISISKKYKVNIVGVILHFFVQMNMYNNLNKNPKETFSLLKTIFSNGSEIGLDFIEIPFMGKTKLSIDMIKLDKFNSLIEKIIYLSDKYSLKVCIENELNINDNKLLLDRIGSNKFFITFDTGNIYALGINTLEFINGLHNKIGNVHIKDCDNSGQSVPLGKGCVNFSNILYELDKINYKDKYILEAVKEDVYFNDNNKNPIHSIKKYCNYIRSISI